LEGTLSQLESVSCLRTPLWGVFLLCVAVALWLTPGSPQGSGARGGDVAASKRATRLPSRPAPTLPSAGAPGAGPAPPQTNMAARQPQAYSSRHAPGTNMAARQPWAPGLQLWRKRRKRTEGQGRAG